MPFIFSDIYLKILQCTAAVYVLIILGSGVNVIASRTVSESLGGVLANPGSTETHSITSTGNVLEVTEIEPAGGSSFSVI